MFDVINHFRRVLRTKPKNLKEFIDEMSEYSKQSIVSTGTTLMWWLYKNRSTANRTPERSKIIEFYGPKVIILALTNTYIYKSTRANERIFHNLCSDYLALSNKLLDDHVVDSEVRRIMTELSDNSDIPNEYITLEHVRSSYIHIFMSRLLRSQNWGLGVSINTLINSYKVYKALEREENVANLVRNIYQIDAIDFFRNSYMLFAYANSRGNAIIDFQHLEVNDDITELLNVNKQTCLLVASKISFDETKLNSWYQNEVLGELEIYQEYVPHPLHMHPIIHLDRDSEYTKFLLPFPQTFVRSLSNSFFSRILANNNDLLSTFGNIIENEILLSLQHIFGEENVNKIEEEGQMVADFHIALPQSDLIVEAKSDLGSFYSQSVMSPSEIVPLWNRLYKATQQCASSMNNLKETDRPIFGIILIGDHAISEAIPFQIFAKISGVYDDLEIKGIDYLSWETIENTLSTTSISKFEESFVAKWESTDNPSVADILNVEQDKENKAHEYEHLQELKEELFNNLI